MRRHIWFLVLLAILSIITGCDVSDKPETELPNQQPLPDPTMTTGTLGTMTIDPFPDCPSAEGFGTIAPSISIFSITFLVNGIEQTISENDVLQIDAGDEVQIKDVAICVNSFQGYGGQACVDFAPADQSGQEVVSEHKGTHLVDVAPGIILISDLDFTWDIKEGWCGILAVLNHWAPEKTQDLDCAEGLCERDDQVFVGFR